MYILGFEATQPAPPQPPKAGAQAWWMGVSGCPSAAPGHTAQGKWAEKRSPGQNQTPKLSLWCGICSLHSQSCLWASVSLSVKWGRQLLWQHSGWWGVDVLMWVRQHWAHFCTQGCCECISGASFWGKVQPLSLEMLILIHVPCSQHLGLNLLILVKLFHLAWNSLTLRKNTHPSSLKHPGPDTTATRLTWPAVLSHQWAGRALESTLGNASHQSLNPKMSARTQKPL